MTIETRLRQAEIDIARLQSLIDDYKRIVKLSPFRVDIWGNLYVHGTIVEGGDNMITGVTASITDTTPTEVIAAQGAGVKIKLKTLLVTNGSEDTGTFVNITDGSGGTVLFSGYAVYGGGFSITFPTPLEFTANTAVYAVCVTTGAAVRVSAVGYT